MVRWGINCFGNYDLLCTWAVQKCRERFSREMEDAREVESATWNRDGRKGLYEEVAFEQWYE